MDNGLFMVLNRTGQIRDSIDDVVQRAFVVELGIVLALFVGFNAYTIALGNVLDPYFLDSDDSLLVLRSALALIGMGALAASYASWRGYSLSASAPDRTDGRSIGAAVVGTAVLATLPFFLLVLRADIGVSHVASTVSDLDALFLDRTLIQIALFVFGMALLYHGFVQGALQRLFGRERGLAVVVTTILSGYLAAPTVARYGTFPNGPWLSLWGNRAAVAVLFVVALGVAVYGGERTDERRVRALWLLPVLAALALVALVLAPDVDSLNGALVMTTRVAVIGVAAYAYDDTESMIAPTLVYATFAAVSTVLHSSAVAAVFGS